MSWYSVPPKGHVEELQPPAHPKDGLAHLSKCLGEGQVVDIAHAVADPLGAQRFLAIVAGPYIRAAVHDQAIEPLRVILQRHIAARCLARGAWHHDHDGAGRHDPVRDRLLNVPKRLVGEQLARGVGMLKTGRKTDLEAGCTSHVWGAIGQRC